MDEQNTEKKSRLELSLCFAWEYRGLDFFRGQGRLNRPFNIFFLIFGITMGSLALGDSAVCSVGECCAALAKVVKRADPSHSNYPAAYQFMKHLESLINAEEKATLGAQDVTLGASSQMRAPPLEEGAEGSKVTYHTGDYEGSDHAMQTRDFDRLRARLSRLAEQLHTSSPQVVDFKFFETSLEKETPESIRDFFEKGERLRNAKDLDERQQNRTKWNRWCTALSAGAGYFLMSGIRRYNNPNARPADEIQKEVLATTVRDEKGHLERLRLAVKEMPDGEKWIKEYSASVVGKEKADKRPFAYHNRFTDYEALKGVSKAEFLDRARDLAAYSRAPVSTYSTTETPGRLDMKKELAESHNDENYNKYGTPKRNGLLNEDELIRLGADSAHANYERMTTYLSVPSLLLGGVTGALSCTQIAERIGLPGFEKVVPTEVSPALKKIHTALAGVVDRAVEREKPGFAKETVWLDSENPDGTYSTLLLEIDRTGRIPKVRLTGLSFSPAVPKGEPIVMDYDPPPAEPHVSADVELGLLKRKLITHRFTSHVGEEFQAPSDLIDQTFSEATSLKLTPAELKIWAKTVGEIHSYEELRWLRHTLIDIKKERRRLADARDKRQKEEDARRGRFEYPQDTSSIYVPTISDFRSPERVINRMEQRLDTKKLLTKGDVESWITQKFATRAEIEAVIRRDFAIARELNMSPMELAAFEKAGETIMEKEYEWSLEGAENYLRDALKATHYFRTMGEEEGESPMIKFPRPSWDGLPPDLYAFLYDGPRRSRQNNSLPWGSGFGGF